MEILRTLAIPIGTLIGALIGYLLGAYKAFREAKQKAYKESLPPILKVAFRRSSTDEAPFNEALCKVWLYGSKKVTKKVDGAASIIVKPTRGDLKSALQEVIVEMRNDVQRYWQFWRRQSIIPADVKHFYIQIQDEQKDIGAKTTE